MSIIVSETLTSRYPQADLTGTFYDGQVACLITNMRCPTIPPKIEVVSLEASGNQLIDIIWPKRTMLRFMRR